MAYPENTGDPRGIPRRVVLCPVPIDELSNITRAYAYGGTAPADKIETETVTDGNGTAYVRTFSYTLVDGEQRLTGVTTWSEVP